MPVGFSCLPCSVQKWVDYLYLEFCFLSKYCCILGVASFLSDLVQDAASKGLGVVYECCSEATRQSMVEGLVQTLTEGKRNIQNVTQDTQIFKEGELGATPSG